MDEKVILSEADILSAMRYYERRAGPGDGISICKEVSQLADLLGVMWFEHETEAILRASSPLAALVQASRGNEIGNKINWDQSSSGPEAEDSGLVEGDLDVQA